jgi:diguanylate cyclase (GGDEF)-like protein/PAS domain S-box-containing protein
VESDFTLMSGVPSSVLLVALAGVIVLTHVVRSMLARSRRQSARVVSSMTEAARPAFEGVMFMPRESLEAGTKAAAIREEYQQLVETMPLVTYVDGLEPNAPSIYISPQLEELIGYSADEWLADDDLWLKLVHPDDRARAHSENKTHVETGRPSRMEYRLRTRDGRWKWFLDEAVIMRDAAGTPIYSRGFMVDITDQKELEQQLAHQAFHDSLTGLANRALFRDRIDHALARRDHAPVAVVYLDLDDFKTVNDTLGHATGDDVLRTAADRLQRSVRRGDTVARLGGDEFAILLEEEPARCEAVAQAVLDAFARPIVAGGREFVLTASIGVVVSDGAADADALIRRADLAMYSAKSKGKGRLEVYTDALGDRARDRLAVRTDLHRALAERELEMYFQPIVELAGHRTVGVEALMRWRHPTRGLVEPIDFIPIAEEAGLVVELGRTAIVAAIDAAIALRRALDDPDLFVTVNLSARELVEDDLPGFIDRRLRARGLDPAGLVVEMTESVLLTDPERAIERLAALRNAGLRIALDDFGTGYSSLSYLGRMPVDILKLAKPFIDAVGSGSKEERLLASLVTLGTDLGLTAVAEGVERLDQAEKLERLGCRLGQGFVFSPPRPLAELLGHYRFSPTPARRGPLEPIQHPALVVVDDLQI